MIRLFGRVPPGGFRRETELGLQFGSREPGFAFDQFHPETNELVR